MRAERPALSHAARAALALLLLTGATEASAQPRGRAPVVTQEPLPLPPPPAPAEEATPAARPEPTAQPQPMGARPLQRRIALAELGLPAGLSFGEAGSELGFPLPRGLAAPTARLVLAFDLAAPFPGRHAVELRADGRVLASQAFPENGGPLALEAELPAELLAPADGLLRLELRLLGDTAATSATLRPESHLELRLPDPGTLSVAALFGLLPPQTQVLLRPGPIGATEAAAALRVGLALAATGRSVSIASAPPGQPLPGPGGTRLWANGAVLVGLGSEAAAVRLMNGQPVLSLGGETPEQLARLLDSPWRGLALAQAVTGGAMGTPEVSPAADSLPFAALRGSMATQESARAHWTYGFATRDLPPGMQVKSLEITLRAAADPGGVPGIGTVLLNGVILGSTRLSAEGKGRLVLPVGTADLAAENNIEILLHRASASGPAQVLPESLLRLTAAEPPRSFLGLPAAFGAGVEVLVDAPGGGLVAEGLNPLLWVLRTLVPAGAPLRVTLAEPGMEATPAGPFVAATLEPPAGSEPVLRFDAGRVLLSNRTGRPLLELGGVQRAMVAQLVTAAGHPGLWLRAVGPAPLLPAAAPRLDRGDVALLDRQGVAMAWASAPAPQMRVSYPETSQDGSWLPPMMKWRLWVIWALWLVGFVLVLVAFLRPRRDPPGHLAV